jgi:hypothetical protein
MAKIELTEKFIGFVDVLGFKSLMRACEAGEDVHQ